jgi:hypothetical protein
VSFRFDGGGWYRPADVDGGAFLADNFEFAPLAQLIDAIPNVSLTATRGDFYFDRAFLAAFGERNEVAVPEPSMPGMLGIALFTFFGWRHRNNAGGPTKISFA